MMCADQATHQDNGSLLIIADAKRGKCCRAAVKKHNESSLRDGLATSDSAVLLVVPPLFRDLRWEWHYSAFVETAVLFCDRAQS